jgi:hypothetical protein
MCSIPSTRKRKKGKNGGRMAQERTELNGLFFLKCDIPSAMLQCSRKALARCQADTGAMLLGFQASRTGTYKLLFINHLVSGIGSSNKIQPETSHIS